MHDTKLRYDFLDWLRVLAIALLLFYHTGMLFVGWGWHIENAQVLTELRWPMGIAHRLRMPLLFIISGAGLWFALRSRSGGEILRERSLRLLVPALVGMLLIVPPQIYFERLFRGQWQGGYLSFFFERVLQFQPYPQGNFSWHHLWFIVYLYVYVLLLLPAMLWWRSARRSLRPGLWLYALMVPLAVNEALLRPLYPETHNLIADWYLFVQYLLFTIYGFILASMPRVWEWFESQRRYTAAATLGLLVGLIVLMSSGIIRSGSGLDACTANVFTWLGLMALLGYGRRYLSRSNAWLQWARDACYPVYIIHQTLIVAVGYFVIQLDWHPWLKFAVVVSATFAGSVVLYEFAVRRWSATRIMFGLKVQPARAPSALRTQLRGAN